MSEHDDEKDLVGEDAPVDHSAREVAAGAVNAGGVDQYSEKGANTIARQYDEPQPGAEEAKDAEDKDE